MTARIPKKRALITGITGQDGSYLAEQLLADGYCLVGTTRGLGNAEGGRVRHLLERETDEQLRIVSEDLTSTTRLTQLIEDVRPDEIYNLAAQSHVHASLESPEATLEANGQGAIRLFEAVRRSGLQIRICQASSSEIFGEAPAPQTEESELHPDNPYALSKALAHQAAKVYRDCYGLFISCPILFNHESPRRGENFVTRKISQGVARIARGLQTELSLGDLDPERDWGFAPEYVAAMRLCLQHETADDFVIATGVSHSVRDFVAAAFSHVGLNWQDHVVVDPRFQRPPTKKRHVGNASKARDLLGWVPRVTFAELVGNMVDADLVELDRQNATAGENAADAS